MAIREIRLENDEILRKKSKKVEKIDEKIKEIVSDMIQTMYSNDGIGIAAVQIGILKRVIVYDISEKQDSPIVLINPQMLKSKGEIVCEEGCLSSPGKFGLVTRADKIEVEGLDINGKTIRIKAKGLESVVLSHEIDHLDGILFIDKVTEYTNKNNAI